MNFKKARKILGMNARNLSYISRYNSKAHKRFADDKIFTKRFLESRGIGVAKLFHVLKNHQQLTDEFFQALPESFVIKPNRGYAGGGILVVVDRKGRFWITASGKRLSKDFLYRHCIDILEGKYSISGTHDDVIFEERLDPHSDFRQLNSLGLPDIRVIVFNLVPVMAMLRVPTPESEGKANMELGAIALGIDMGTGRTNGAALKSKFIKKLPNGESAFGFQVPYWEDILHSVSKIQQVTKIGFLGVDFVITKTGVKVLEVNARPGLKIQIANRTPLKVRLEKVNDLKVLSPEDGVEIAKRLFSVRNSSLSEEFEEKPLLGFRENVRLNTENPKSLVAQIDPSQTENIIRSGVWDPEEKILDITLASERLKIPVRSGDTPLGVDLVLSTKYLGGFYIDPQKNFEKVDLVQVAKSDLDERMLLNVDEKVAQIDQSIKLLSYINPRNLEEQKSIFMNHEGVSPHFLYKSMDLDLPALRSELKRIPQVNHRLYPLYAQKIEELMVRLDLLEARGSKDFGFFSQKIFGRVTRNLYQSALAFLKEHEDYSLLDESALLDARESRDLFQDFLDRHKLGHWKIKIIEDSVVDVQVTKKDVILLKKGAQFRHNRLQALLVHEIGTHVFRFENGKKQPLRIFERGTAGYLQTEEGLAIWNQNQLGLLLGDKFLTPAFLVVAIYMAQKMTFYDLYHYLKSTFKISNELAWKLCVKSKRGLENTEMMTAFTKDSIYFSGLAEVERFLKKGGRMSDLYVGKITTQDIPLVSTLEGLKPPKLLLEWERPLQE
jgi:alpha-L-glutamate ligase-like protein/uncharacterized protein (TIGR02421 family)